MSRKPYYREDFNRYDKHRSSKRSPNRSAEKRRSRSPPRRRSSKEALDDSIMREIAKLPEPNELWDNQFQENFPAIPPAPTFSQEGTSYQAYSGLYDDFPPVGSTVPPPPQPPDISWNQPPVPSPATPAPFFNLEDQIKKEAAIESEMRHQKAALSKQREECVKKASVLKKELDTLKDQRNELRGDNKRSPSPDSKRFLKENAKLQLEIQNKLKSIHSVVDMLNKIIGEEVSLNLDGVDESPEHTSTRHSRSPTSDKKFNYVYYDPEMHWCRICNEYPSTAKDYLNHLHSPSHHKIAAAHTEAPWHSVTGLNEGFPSYPSAATKRTPIRGLQFFVPSTAWYCKLCDQFIGDLHCASAHLKSVIHSKNYSNFVEQNPHWETDWMSDRQKALEKIRAVKIKSEEKQNYASHTITFNKDGTHTQSRNTPSPIPVDILKKKNKKKEKKKTKKRRRSSSSSSSSKSSKSSESDHVKKKKPKTNPKKEEKSVKSEPEDKTVTQWMSSLQVNELTDKDKRLLDTLKHRIKDANHKKSEALRRSSEQTKVRERVRSVVDSQPQNNTKENEQSKEQPNKGKKSKVKKPSISKSTTPTREFNKETAKKPEVKRMPFIGKMPVFKSLGTRNQKPDDQKKDETKKKDEEDAVTKKRKDEMDTEIQKRVAEFKEKIARAQQEREHAVMLMAPPGMVFPTELGLSIPQANFNQPPPINYNIPPPQLLVQPPPQPLVQPPLQPLVQPPPQPPPNQIHPNLPKDFQDALDIIFPSEMKRNEDGILGSHPNMPTNMGIPPPLMGPPFMPPMGMIQPSQLQMSSQVMMGFDLNNAVYGPGPRPQLYDRNVPLVPSPKPKSQQKKTVNTNIKKKNSDNKNSTSTNKQPIKSKADLEDLAMLGIDASDVVYN